MEKNASLHIQSRVLNSASFLAQFAISMVNLSLVYHMRIQFSLSAQMVGLSAAVYTSTYFLCCLVLGPLVAHLRPRHSVEISMVGMGISILILLQTTQVGLAFLSLVLYGCAMSFLWPQIESWIARGKEGRALNRATSSFNVSWSLGSALSPFLTGILVEISTDTPLLTGVALFILVFLLIVTATLLVPGIKAVVSERKNIEDSTMQDQSTPLRFLSWAGVLTVYVSLAVILTIFPLHAMDNLPYSESKVGVLLLIRGAATVAMFVIMGKTSWWHFNRAIVIGAQILFGVVCLLGTRIHSFGMYSVFFLLFGMLFAAVYSFSIFHGASGSINRSKRMLIHEILLTIGTVVGSIMGGTIYQYLDFRRVLFFCATLVAIPAVGAIFNSVRKLTYRQHV
ncbi:MAG: MFS transporter [Sphaerochaeta sp.]|nr:MFS transporter [Sphaerochaeta sp.]